MRAQIEYGTSEHFIISILASIALQFITTVCFQSIYEFFANLERASPAFSSVDAKSECYVR